MDCWIWQEGVFDNRSAWIDILLLANHKGKKFLLGKELVTVERGQIITSELKLMKRWGWSKNKVRGFLDLLEKDKMIIKKTDRKKTTLTVVNYSVYQDMQTAEEPQKDHEGTAIEPPMDTNNNVNHDKQCNNNECIVEIINYLNEKNKSDFKTSTNKTKSLISARLKEGFTVDDFKAVIDVKTTEWLDDQHFKKYLQPSTLFSGNFEGYLNQAKISKPKAPQSEQAMLRAMVQNEYK